MSAASDKPEASTKPRKRKRRSGRGTIIAKAKILGGEAAESGVPLSNLVAIDDLLTQRFQEAGAIEPPLPPLVLTRLTTISNCLRQNVEAMVANVHGFGHHFERIIDFDSAEGWEQVKAAMLIEQERDAELAQEPSDASKPLPEVEVSDDEVNKRVEELKARAFREHARLKAFFENACEGISFTRLRKRAGADRETTGYAAWEVLRDRLKRPRRLRHAPAWTMRALPRDSRPTEVTVRYKATDITLDEEREHRYFRRYVQIYEGHETYFQEFGDPRCMSAETGNYYADVDAMRKQEPKARKATELIWFKLDAPETDVYGVPRWGGNLLSVIGSREMEEVNLLFWQHKSIPPMAVLISGGRLAKGAEQKLTRILEDQAKGGRENFHKILVIQAEPVGRSSAGGLPSQDRVRIELQPLTEAIWKDELWSTYDKNNRAKVGQSFRIPPILRGETVDFNRATAEAAVAFAEVQVFVPERADFDFEMNRTLLPALGISLWRFVTNGPRSKQPDKVVEFATKLVESVVAVEEAREFVGDVLGMDLKHIDAPWAKLPVRFALAGFQPESEEEEAESEAEGEAELPSAADRDDDGSQEPVEPKRGINALPRQTLRIDQSLMDELVEPLP